MNFIAAIGRVMLNFLESTGRLAIFTGISVSHIFRPPFYPRLLLRQVIDIGYYSLPVVGLTAVFTGMVLALQSYSGFATVSYFGVNSLHALDQAFRVPDIRHVPANCAV